MKSQKRGFNHNIEGGGKTRLLLRFLPEEEEEDHNYYALPNLYPAPSMFEGEREREAFMPNCLSPNSLPSCP